MSEKIVTVSGGFDPVHIGHVRMIRGAAQLGKLIVILNNDAFLMRKKGFVFMPLEERKEILENIKGVDSVFVAIDEDDSVCKSLEAIKPDIFANGGDRKAVNEIREADVCKRLGIEMVFNVGGGKVQSSSWLTGKKNERKS
ncbi:MAG: adenylyltransferase/cytidyltransferase family protein [Dehalococcoidales bacterium]|jgi:D-beta-D-heptose 7-phosphate kinase/D-beta-D-heptose 1-phosphate adenosyltransferase|nr:adenylyltransferase/cytidyltransferase family protein [Dehalococcoidales bacterium]